MSRYRSQEEMTSAHPARNAVVILILLAIACALTDVATGVPL
jgi:hypothetical protein